MTQSDAHAVASWRYPGIYAFYDADDLVELLDPRGWGLRYFAVQGRRRACRARRLQARRRRAITVYERAGFTQTNRYVHATNGAVHDFLRMTRGPL
jgi:hypothetical protein